MHDRWVAHLRVPRPGGGPEGPSLPEDTLEVVLRRRLGPVMAEHIELLNHSMAPYEGRLTLELGADFVDIQHVDREVPGSRTEPRWDARTKTLTFDFHAEHEGVELHRALRVAVAQADSDVECSSTTLGFDVALGPRSRWAALLHYESLVDGSWRVPADLIQPDGAWGSTDRDAIRERWHAGRTHLDSGHHVLAPAFERAAADLFALRNWELDVARDAWVPHAGVPKYTGLFGRDTLTAAWQSAMLDVEMARGALELMARTQGSRDDPWRDEEPDKLVHEMRRGPLSALNVVPHGAYYGTQTTAAMFVLTLSEYWHWTGDVATVERHRDAALRTFEWARRYGDRDGDGFLEYDTRSDEGLKNQAWKDSDEGIRYPDGSQVPNPIATVEEQAFHCLAMERMAQLLIVLGDDERAEEFLEQAKAFRWQWHSAFWMEDERFYALALDGEKRQVRSIASNPGHALATGIVPPDFARRVADRLMAPDLFSGWGIRTLSSDHPSYNPFGYHLGPVWPVENATFALGFKRYGLDDHAERLVSALVAAAGAFSGIRLPESLGGHERKPHSLPTIYPESCSPQAWSASATIQFLQVMLGLYPFAAANVLALVRPRLPDWIDALTLRNLRVGESRLTIRFERNGDGTTSHHVVEREGALAVLEVPPPVDAGDGSDPLTARLASWLLEHAPGRTARAARIALGELDG